MYGLGGSVVAPIGVSEREYVTVEEERNLLDMVLMVNFGGPQALLGGAKPDVYKVTSPKVCSIIF
ncbi:hypothetical protein T10_5381 [Trichinella papuae]|uniref:Uncharacterized protein n=1 Tax=Trichinella papuae TaxID=268474 RepID=A0A0V1LWY3_9BILA|nr:hypothetical protein T10_5381 [Trichinella papuae]